MKNQRENYIDLIKGIGVLFVIIGHNIPNSEYIYSFHMPMFFIISGLLSNNSSKNFFIKKYNSNMVNYIFYSLILLTFWIIIGKKMEFNSESSTTILNGIIGFFIFNNIENISSMRWGAPMWFFPTLFIIQILNKKFFKSTINILILIFIIIILFKYNIKFIFNLKTIFIGLSFYKIGEYYSKNTDIKIFLSKKINILILFFISIGLFQINGRVDLANGKIGYNMILFYIVAISGSFFWIEVCKKIGSNKFLEIIGINSVVFIVFHERALTFIKGISIYIFKLPIYKNLISIIIYTLFQILICFFIMKIDKKYLSFLKNKLKLEEKNDENIDSIRTKIFKNE